MSHNVWFGYRFPIGYRPHGRGLIARPMLFGQPRAPVIRIGMWTLRIGFYACVCMLSVTAGQELQATMMDKLEGKDGFPW
jgi:hypothetical protein